MSENETQVFAAWVEEWRSDEPLRKLVVVEAESEGAARREAGLPFTHFHRATEEELLAWETITDRPLTEGDAEALISLVARELRALAAKQRKSRERGQDERALRDALRARLLNQLRGRLELIEAEPDVFMGRNDPGVEAVA